MIFSFLRFYNHFLINSLWVSGWPVRPVRSQQLQNDPTVVRKRILIVIICPVYFHWSLSWRRGSFNFRDFAAAGETEALLLLPDKDRSFKSDCVFELELVWEVKWTNRLETKAMTCWKRNYCWAKIVFSGRICTIFKENTYKMWSESVVLFIAGWWWFLLLQSFYILSTHTQFCTFQSFY